MEIDRSAENPWGWGVFHVNSLGIDTMLDELQRCVAPQLLTWGWPRWTSCRCSSYWIAFGFFQPQVPVDLRLDVYSRFFLFKLPFVSMPRSLLIYLDCFFVDGYLFLRELVCFLYRIFDYLNIRHQATSPTMSLHSIHAMIAFVHETSAAISSRQLWKHASTFAWWDLNLQNVALKIPLAQELTDMTWHDMILQSK